jgi:hypothetical protein
MLFGDRIQQTWLQTTDVRDWSSLNHALNFFISLLNTTLLIWLYASLRPMYGVGTKTALITSAVGIVWGVSLMANLTNLGLIPMEAGLVEAAFVTIELPIAMLAGAAVYEGDERSEAGPAEA